MATGAIRPSVGRMVHYTSYGTPGGEYKSQCRAAIVTAVDPNDNSIVDLCVLNPEGQFFNKGVHLDSASADETNTGGHWHWPERVGD